MAGSVRMQGGGSPERRQQLALVNVISLLCRVVVRDLVASVTSRSRHGQMLLPTLNVAKLAVQPLPFAMPAAPAKKSKKASAKPRTSRALRRV